MQKQFGINAVRTIRRASLLTTVLLLTSQIALAQWNTNSPHIYNSNSGNVGIGTSAPPELFSLLGGNVAVSTSGSSSSSPTTVGLKFTGSSGETGAFIFGDLLNSLGAMNGGKMLVQSFWGMKIVANRQSATAYSFENGNASGVPVLEVAADNTGSYAALGPVLLVVGASGQSANLQEWKNSSGTVLATVSPAGNITTVGNITASGNIAAKYQDLAEWVPAVGNLKAGTVVILDPDKTNTVMASHGSYDTRVAGVVSDLPGIVLGEAGEGKVKVATSGRVKVRVDASQGGIQTGDLLVTSDREGIAMKSVPMNIDGRKMHQPGTLIGKALEPFAEGEGEILVLLSLQ